MVRLKGNAVFFDRMSGLWVVGHDAVGGHGHCGHWPRSGVHLREDQPLRASQCLARPGHRVRNVPGDLRRPVLTAAAEPGGMGGIRHAG
jgi:hypothetical protein